MLFSEWFRQQQTRQDDVGAAARAWNALPSLDRRGRVNAERLVRTLGTPGVIAAQAIREHQEAAINTVLA
jgi:hypothetical protein